MFIASKYQCSSKQTMYSRTMLAMSQNNSHARTPNPTSYHHADIVDTYTKPKICIQIVRLYSCIELWVYLVDIRYRMEGSTLSTFQSVLILMLNKSHHIYKNGLAKHIMPLTKMQTICRSYKQRFTFIYID